MKTPQTTRIVKLLATSLLVLTASALTGMAAGKGGGGGNNGGSTSVTNLAAEIVQGDFTPSDPTVPVVHAPDFFGKAEGMVAGPIFPYFDQNYQLRQFRILWSDPDDISVTPQGSSVVLDNEPFIVTQEYDDDGDGAIDRIGISLLLSPTVNKGKAPRYKTLEEDVVFNPYAWPLGDVEPLLDGTGELYGFIAHVHAESVPIYERLHESVIGPVLGYISIGDLVFRLDAEGNDLVPEGADPYPGD